MCPFISDEEKSVVTLAPALVRGRLGAAGQAPWSTQRSSAVSRGPESVTH
jgi:hypothetical protein